jgi:hypothetical protein
MVIPKSLKDTVPENSMKKNKQQMDLILAKWNK